MFRTPLPLVAILDTLPCTLSWAYPTPGTLHLEPGAELRVQLTTSAPESGQRATVSASLPAAALNDEALATVTFPTDSSVTITEPTMPATLWTLAFTSAEEELPLLRSSDGASFRANRMRMITGEGRCRIVVTEQNAISPAQPDQLTRTVQIRLSERPLRLGEPPNIFTSMGCSDLLRMTRNMRFLSLDESGMAAVPMPVLLSLLDAVQPGLSAQFEQIREISISRAHQLVAPAPPPSEN